MFDSIPPITIRRDRPVLPVRRGLEIDSADTIVPAASGSSAPAAVASPARPTIPYFSPDR